ncbi:hypothetical protein BJ508DRAFT_156272 [Ascobolus immersus RN42]|uniref:F-box domain-containing protein n=1 Tax=Ascobolus immersus RN42 TaxID=1160509 RepID=A0A3N4I0V0_ASCIM|nr:hypothetical protein BJ508DRAFT_156272 [Ascobolus immersus RN42]
MGSKNTQAMPQPSLFHAILSLPLELRLDIYTQCTAFTLLQLPHTSHFFRTELNSPTVRPLILTKGSWQAVQHMRNYRPKSRSPHTGAGISPSGTFWRSSPTRRWKCFVGCLMPLKKGYWRTQRLSADGMASGRVVSRGCRSAGIGYFSMTGVESLG